MVVTSKWTSNTFAETRRLDSDVVPYVLQTPDDDQISISDYVDI